MNFTRINKKKFLVLVAILLCILVSGCSGGFSNLSGNNNQNVEPTGNQVDLEYATQLTIEELGEDRYTIHIEDGLNYYILPKGEEVPKDIQDNAEMNYTVIHTPVSSVYMAASSVMSLIQAIDSMGEESGEILDSVTMTSTKESDWGLPWIATRLSDGDLQYVGKYSAPDYEAILFNECDLTVESTMIYHSPEVKEAIEALGVPVLVERSSYEPHPLGRLEWIKLYGILFDREEDAKSFFDESVEQFKNILTETENVSDEQRPSVAFFSISTNNYATVRKPGDYISQMIYMAGGKYALKDIPVSDENALSTENIQLESLFEHVVDADIIIYNGTIQGEITKVSELLDKFPSLEACKAVKEGNVWCTNRNLFQQTAGICDMIYEMNLIITGSMEDAEYEASFFHKLQ